MAALQFNGDPIVHMALSYTITGLASVLRAPASERKIVVDYIRANGARIEAEAKQGVQTCIDAMNYAPILYALADKLESDLNQEA